VEPPPSGERRAHVPFEGPTMPRMWVGYRVPAATVKTKETAAAHVLGRLLFGPQGRLYKELVLERQLLVDLRPYLPSQRDPHLMGYIATARSESSLAEVERLIDAAIEEIREGKADPTMIAAVQSNLRYGTLMELETPEEIADALVRMTAATGDPKSLPKFLDQVAKVTPRDIAAFAKAYLGKERRTVVTLSSGKGGAR